MHILFFRIIRLFADKFLFTINMRIGARNLWFWRFIFRCSKEKMKTDKSSQRAVNRIEKRQEISFFTYWPPQKTYKGQIQDLSPNGMRFFTDQPLNKDQVIKIDSKVLQATARVANRRKQRSDLQMVYGIGVEFVTLQFQESHGTFVSVTA